jgi:hypothetical protein
MSRPVRQFLRHYAEMVIAMVAGMIVLGAPLDMLLPGGNVLMLLNMGFSMTVPMVGWMRYRGHGWRASGEMAAAMVVPTLAAIAVYGAGVVEDIDAVMLGEHVVMLGAMLGVMLLRRSEYVHHHALATSAPS